jgi:hypothetical protein
MATRDSIAATMMGLSPAQQRYFANGGAMPTFIQTAQGQYQDPRFGQPMQAPEVPPLILTGPNVPSPLDPTPNRATFFDRFPNPEDFQVSDPTMQAQRGNRLDRVIPPEEREPIDPNDPRSRRDFTDSVFDEQQQPFPTWRFPTNEETMPQRTYYSDSELGVRPQPPEQFPSPRRGEPPMQDFTPTFPYQQQQQQFFPQQQQSLIDTFSLPNRTSTGFDLTGGADAFRGSPRGLDIPSRMSRLLGAGPYVNQTGGRY